MPQPKAAYAMTEKIEYTGLLLFVDCRLLTADCHGSLRLLRDLS